MSATVSIKIRNWRKFNPRKDVTHSSWFRLEHDMIESEEFFSLTDAEFKAWIYILSRASKANSETAVIDFERAERVCKIKKATIESLIEKFQRFPEPPASVTTTSRVRNAADTQTNATRRDGRDETVSSDVPAAVEAPPMLGWDLEIQKTLQGRGVKQTLLRAWADAYPMAYIENKIRALLTWEIANPRKRKKDFGRFVTNCLSRDYDQWTAKLPSGGSGPRLVAKNLDDIA